MLHYQTRAMPVALLMRWLALGRLHTDELPLSNYESLLLRVLGLPGGCLAEPSRRMILTMIARLPFAIRLL